MRARAALQDAEMVNLVRARGAVWLITGTTARMAAAVLLAVKLTPGEKKIERRVDRLYSIDDPRFAQELGVLLGPPFLEGNRHRALRNGDEIFPPMLAAIRGASGWRSRRHRCSVFCSEASASAGARGVRLDTPSALLPTEGPGT